MASYTYPLAVLITGAEVLDGRVLDTNSQYIAQQLSLYDLQPSVMLKVGDDIDDICRALEFLDAEMIIVSGGLGPTTDDLTRDAIARFAGVELVRHEESAQRLEEYARSRKRTLSVNNMRQAFVPAGSEVLANTRGTAPGFLVRRNDVRGEQLIFALPGVPAELRAMLATYVLPQVTARLGATALFRHSFRIFGLPEAEVGLRIERIGLPPQILVSYRAAMPEIHVVLKSAITLDEAHIEAVRRAIGLDNIVSEDIERGLEQVVHELALRQKVTVAVAESCTGGLLGSFLSSQPGSSAYLQGGVISYSNEVKQKLLRVERASLEAHGAVSEQVAIEMATGARICTGAQIGLSITGVAGPDGGSEAKPVGTFYIGIATPQGTQAFRFFFPSFRARVRTFAAYSALDVLRRALLGLPLRNETPDGR